MIHVTRNRRCEIVIFGRDQRLLPPVVLGGAGPILLNASPDDTRVQISRVGADDPGQAEARIDSDCRLGAVVRQVANLGATYPEVLAILRAAEGQRNLEGPLVEDAVPDPQARFDRAQLAGAGPTAEVDPAVGRAALKPTAPEPAAAGRRPHANALGRLRKRFRGRRPVDGGPRRVALDTSPDGP